MIDAPGRAAAAALREPVGAPGYGVLRAGADHGIFVRVERPFSEGCAVRSGEVLDVTRNETNARFTLPRTVEYELVELG